MNKPVPKPFVPPRSEDVQASMNACLLNADRLMYDAVQFEFEERGSMRLAISMLAQEEYAKAFILYLVRDGLVPWDSDLLRVIRNHACKHLVGIAMEYIGPEWETIDELRAIINAEYDLEGRFPPRVSSALNILYHEKIRRGGFFDDEDYEPEVTAIAFGERDKIKQDAIYVDLDRSCRVRNAPMGVTKEEAQVEYTRAERYGSIVRSVIGPGAYEGLQLQKLKEALKIVFWQKYRPLDVIADDT